MRLERPTEARSQRALNARLRVCPLAEEPEDDRMQERDKVRLPFLKNP